MVEHQMNRPLSHLGLSPLTHPAPSYCPVLVDRGFPGFVQILTTPGKRDGLAKLLGLDLSDRAACQFEQWMVLPITPFEWAAIGPETSTYTDLVRLIGDLGFVSDQSNSRNRFLVSGPHCETILSKGCPIDFDPRIARAGTWAQSLFHEISVLVYKSEETPAFDIYCYAGFAESLWHGMMDAGREFGLQSYAAQNA